MQQATLKIDEAGIRVTVEEGRSLQAHAYVSANAFSSYSFHLAPDDPAAYVDAPEPADSPGPSSPPAGASPQDLPTNPYCQMSVSLSTILECLNIFGNAGGSGMLPFKREADGDDSDAAEGGRGGGANRWKGKRKRQGGDEDDEDEGRRGRFPSRRAHTARAEDGRTTSLRMSYAGHGEPLVMLLEESGIVTRCEITTYEPEGLLDLAFHDEEKVQRLIIKSDWLRDALLEVPSSSEKLSISFAPSDANEVRYRQRQAKRARASARRRSKSEGRGAAGSRTGVLSGDENDKEGGAVQEHEEDEEEEEVPLFRLESTGPMGSTEMDYSDDKDVLEVFECEQSLRNSRSIRTNDHGLVSFQFMIPMSTRGPKASMKEGKIGFVEFLCVALDEEY
ncbi:checkpoint clamp complex protein Rad1 [Rhodotorula sphaerocarpa]